ncbi:MAG TPA: histidine triad nucleotide-binding protein [Anaerolineales bacterium]|jgi:histidine triad (HIT) family protein
MFRAVAINLFARYSVLRYKMNPSCLFCKIASGDAPANIVYQDDLVTAFRDIHPVAPIHVLIVPNKHIPSLSHAEEEDENIFGRLFTVARKVAEMENISEGGYRTIINTGVQGGQTVLHLHLHVIGGQRMRYPIG